MLCSSLQVRFVDIYEFGCFCLIWEKSLHLWGILCQFVNTSRSVSHLAERRIPRFNLKKKIICFLVTLLYQCCCYFTILVFFLKICNIKSFSCTAKIFSTWGGRMDRTREFVKHGTFLHTFLWREAMGKRFCDKKMIWE